MARVLDVVAAIPEGRAMSHEAQALDHYRTERTPLLRARTAVRVDLAVARWIP
mgnify:CR=1 FL=1